MAIFSYQPSNMAVPNSIEEAADLIRKASATSSRVLIHAGGTKWDAGHQRLDQLDQVSQSESPHTVISTRQLTGIVEYEPSELTITAQAGTPLKTVIDTLADHGQYLPFDPVFAEDGATLGGTVAAGLSGSRRMRYGGLRDFVIGVQFLNSKGEVVRGGGKVVKNAAGYDFPKLFCGSMGALGMITQVSFKVFPRPEARKTIRVELPANAEVVQTLFRQLEHSPIEISAADAFHDTNKRQFTVMILIEGTLASLDARVAKAVSLLPSSAFIKSSDTESMNSAWNAHNALTAFSAYPVILKCYLPPTHLAEFDNAIKGDKLVSIAGNTCWVGLSDDPAQVVPTLTKLEATAAVWRSTQPAPDILPASYGVVMRQRVKQAFDPNGLFY